MSNKIVGVTGVVASGKSTLCRKLCELDKEFFHIDVDDVINELYKVRSDEGVELREALFEIFGNSVISTLGQIDVFSLAYQVFDKEDLSKGIYNYKDNLYLNKLAEISSEPVGKAIQKIIEKNPNKIYLLDYTFIAENKFIEKCYNNVILVGATPEELLHRIEHNRGNTREFAINRVATQIPSDEKAEMINKAIERSGKGKLIEVSSSYFNEQKLIEEIKGLFDE